MTQPASRKHSLWKTLPGFVISGFFLWYTFHNVSYRQLISLRFAAPVWIAGIAVFLVAGYALRIHRWWWMLRRNGSAKFSVCARVLLTSFAANNIMPFRVGDFMRIFSYADDLGSNASVILSTVMLERLLDIFSLLLIFVLTMGHGRSFPTHHVRALAETLLGGVSLALLVLILGARVLEDPVKRLIQKLPANATIKKMENWFFLALDAIRQIGILGTLWLVLESLAVWACEGMIFVSAARLLGIATDLYGPWQALAASNLSYLVPSSPGAIGTFEAAAKLAMVNHGADPATAVLYGLLVHAVVLITVTAAGGVLFLWHRYHRALRKPLSEEMATLPAEIS